MKIKLTRTLMIFITVIILSGGLVAYASTTLFTQTFPSQTFNAPLVQNATCAEGGSLNYTNTSVLGAEGAPSTLIVACFNKGLVGIGAFAPLVGTSSIKFIPTFTLPTGWNLAVDTIGISGPYSLCANGANQVNLASGVGVSLLSGDNYFYCLTSSSSSNFTSFSITWSI